jgi:hypothetical protein
MWPHTERDELSPHMCVTGVHKQDISCAPHPTLQSRRGSGLVIAVANSAYAYSQSTDQGNADSGLLSCVN